MPVESVFDRLEPLLPHVSKPSARHVKKPREKKLTPKKPK